MSKQTIISISREFGSMGHHIAGMIASDMGLKLYDRSILDEMAKEKNIKLEYLEKYDEKPKNVMLSRRVGKFSNSIEEVMAELQFEYLREKAKTGESFIVVGRCGETVFKDHEGLISIFVTGNFEDKVNHIMEYFKISRNEAISKINRHDKARKRYHNYHSDFKWGDSRYYDLCINSNKLELEETVKVLETYIKARMDRI